MFPPFPQEIARSYIINTIARLEDGFSTSGSQKDCTSNKSEAASTDRTSYFKLERLTKESEERKGQGIMLGCLVGWDKTTKERVVLLAVSGISVQLKVQNGTDLAHADHSFIQNGTKYIIVPPLATEKEISAALLAHDKKIHELTYKINELPKNAPERLQLEHERTLLTDESLQKVFNLYEFTRFDGKKITLQQIIKEHGGKLPPTGTGDCCAPKLLSYAFEHGLEIVSMDEVFYGKDTPNKKNGLSYPPCDERCGYILPSILGIEILYRDSQIVVVNKSSGLLSVPGRGENKQDCVVNRIKSLFPDCIEQPSVHRLDMETSGILVLAFTEQAHKNLNMQFEKGLVHKKYEALLDGVLEKADGLNVPHNGEKEGIMKLKFRLDVENRPHQIYDEINGKEGITEWQKMGTEYFVNPITGKKKKSTRITFIPHTGRTHQLRLASSDFHGFNMPIIGDSLYGTLEEGERLMLHAKEITFFHPTSGEPMHFTCKPPF
ncbi:MAG: RluA family pseudouridine synthase [Treponema sp.]|nr:RluA family pseudouridine synthase [Treponema sp.]